MQSSEADDRLNQILNDLGPPEPRLNRKDDVQLTLNLYSRWDAAPGEEYAEVRGGARFITVYESRT